MDAAYCFALSGNGRKLKAKKRTINNLGALLKTTLSLILLSILLSPIATGCRHSANLHNPRVALAVTLLDASNVTVTVADGLTAADQVLDKLQTSDPEYYAHVKPLLVKIAKLNDVASTTIVKAKNGDTSANWKGAVTAVGLAVAQSDLTAFGFKNPNSQALVQDGFAVLITGLSMASQFGGTK